MGSSIGLLKITCKRLRNPNLDGIASMHHLIFLRTIVLLVLILLSSVVSAQSVTVAVASNLKPAFDEIYRQFQRLHPQELRIVYGSSGNLSSQIQQGAPISLFIAADEIYPLCLFQTGMTLDAGMVYAIGHLVFITNTASGMQLSNQVQQIPMILAQSKKIAIANPDVAPYGKAAVQYLQSAHLWDQVKGKLVFGENISIATTYVRSGAANAGFSALSLVKSPELASSIRYILLPEASYPPIKQRMVLMKNPDPLAVALYEYLQSSTAQIILQQYGYSVPSL
jgi:molybdate transport system substrate-binding protein